MSSYSQAIGVRERSRPAGSAVRVSALAAALVPSLGAAVFSAALVIVLFTTGGTQALFHDSDAGWHIRNGETILATGSVPRTDRFSFTRPAQPWLAWEWTSDVLLGAAHRLGGTAGVALVAACAIALAAWGVFRVALSLGGNLFFAAIAAELLLGVTSIHWLARPHIFSWLVALLFMAIAEHERRSLAGSRWLYWLPAASCLWANLHGSFLLGPGILAVYAFGEWLNGLYEQSCDREAAAPKFLSRRFSFLLRKSARRLAIASIACFAATFINPYGWRLHAHIFSYLRDAYLMDHIAEFRSFSFHAPAAMYVELFLVVAIVGTLALVRQRAFGPALLAVVLLHFSLYSARYFPESAVLLLPLFVAALTSEAERLPALRGFINYSQRARAIERKVGGSVLVMLALALTVGALTARARAGRVGFDPGTFPVRAADYLEQRGLDSRVFAKDQWGGYLIYLFNGRLKVFLDGRSDYYGRDMLETYATVMEVKPGWDSVLRQFGVQFVLAAPDHALSSVLSISPQWKRVYADSTAIIFERIA